MRKSVFFSGWKLAVLAAVMLCCGRRVDNQAADPVASTVSEINRVINAAPGTVGVAIVSDRDTLLFNNGVRFPMMSVFKLHQSLAVADALKQRGWRADTLLHVAAKDIDRETWSPMLKKYPTEDFDVSVTELMRYALEVSDNNASNLLFERVVGPEASDRYVRSIAPDTTFRILCTESAMKRNHELSYGNYTSPLSVALLIQRVMTDDKSFSGAVIDSIRKDLQQVSTGADRLAVVAQEENGVEVFAHKTGSGYRNSRGELIAHNDVGYFRLSDGRSYSMAVLIRDFRGTEAEASAVISRIGRLAHQMVLSSKASS